MSSNQFPFFYFNLILLLCLLNQLFQTNAISRSNETDLVSLMAIKDGIEGISSWNRSSHFCQWQGITCGKRHQRVITLNLSSQNLVGSLSPHIGNLSFLRFINLENNKFYGEIPPSLGNLPSLKVLNMGSNNLEGSIPDTLGRLSSLSFFSVQRNRLSGKVPLSLYNISSITHFSIPDNQLTGSLPPNMGITLPNLVRFWAGGNQLSGPLPVSLGNASSLQVLSIGGNNLEGRIPDTLGKLSSLSFFSVQQNKLSGTVPLSLYNISSIEKFSIILNDFTGSLPPDMGITLPNLVFFSVGGNHFSGPLPVSLANASNIQFFSVIGNTLTGQVPTNLGALQNLQTLTLANNHLGRGEADDLSFVTSLTNCSNLKQLFLDSNTFGGVIPNSIANLSSKLESLSLGNNRISGIIPEGIGNLVNLIGLGLEINMLHGSIPSSIGNIQKLQLLYLVKNNLTGPIPSSLGNLTQLSDLDIRLNQLDGNIPSSLGGYQHMQRLLLSRNNLNGTIPKQIFGGTSSLSDDLELADNSFTGSLPVEVGNLINIKHMDFSGNKLSGEIPSTLASCISLESLYMQNNLFDGTIPQSLGSLKIIEYLDLSSNNLSGQIPNSLEDISTLQYLNLSFNNLEGEVPMKGIFANASAVSLDGNFKLCGGIRELQLPICERKPHKKHGKSIAFILAIAISVSLFSVLASSLLVLGWKRKTKQNASLSSMEHKHMKISYRDIFEATGGFSPTNFLGSGSFGHVYKGILLKQNGKIVAVKVFNLNRKDASKVFMAECESLRTIRHRNLVKILTSCSSIDSEGNDFKALVFEYMENGSLERWLYRGGDEQDDPSGNLDFPQRLDIAIDVASGLKYLHHEGHISIVHRDLKPSNVLLDSDMVAHVGDFGLAKLLSRSEEGFPMNQSTSVFVKGSIGYAAPEYGMGSVASIHADVYSYGVLLLEMFTGHRPTDEMFTGGLNLHNYAREAFLDRAIQIVDPILLFGEVQTTGDPFRIKYLDCIYEVLRIGVACSVDIPTERMDMRDVNRELLVIKESLLRTRMNEEIIQAQDS